MRAPREMVALALWLLACDAGPTPSPPSPTAAPAEPDACEPVAALAALDTRIPVPLQPMMAWHQKQNMQQHLVAIQRITDALAREAYDEVASASAPIEASAAMQQTCEHMGAGAPGFTDLALDFHQRANAIGEAARARDAAAVLRATARTLEACTSCHATYRQQIVGPASWPE